MTALVLFFVLGLVARLARSDLRVPPAAYELLSIFLLLAIGLKGGAELARQPLAVLLPQIGAVLAMGLLLPLLAFPLLRLKLPRADAASIAAHYGSVSVVTFAVGVAALSAREIAYESHFPVFVAILEAPAIIVGVLLARWNAGGDTQWGPLLREVLAGKSVLLLVGGLVIGWAAGESGQAELAPFWSGLFTGALCLFLLEMGLVTAARLGDLRRAGAFLVAFGLGFPLLGAAIGLLNGLLLGLSPGGVALMMTLGASASYIAAPAAMRIAVPEANPALSIAVALGVTFPFNIVLGVPLYVAVASRLVS